jgi:hypothetical protein
MGKSTNKSDKHLFLYKLTMQNFDEILLCKHCKEEAFVVTYFLPLIRKKYKKNIREHT